MDPERDAYGQAIRDYHERGEGFELVERDDGWIGPSAGPAQYFREYDDWPARQRAALEHVSGRVLDVGCGAGRHVLHLQDGGHDVVGVDRSPLAIEVCRDRGVAETRELDIAAIDELEGTFDTVLMFGNNFGLVGTRETAAARLDALASITTPTATLLAESRDPYATEDPDHLSYHAFNEERGRLGGALRMRIRYKRYATDWFDYLLASQSELAAIVADTSWSVTGVIDGQDDATAYVAILEKS